MDVDIIAGERMTPLAELALPAAVPRASRQTGGFEGSVERAERYDDGVSESLVRKWRSRAKREPASAAPSTATGAASGELDSGIEGLRRAVGDARELERLGSERARELLNTGQEEKSRQAATVAGIASDKARLAEKALREAEAEHGRQAAQLTEEHLELIARVIRASFEALALPLPVESLRAALAGEVPEDVARPDRERVRAAIRSEYLDELLAQGWTPPGEGDAADESPDAEIADAAGEAEPEEPPAQEADPWEGDRSLPPWSEVSEEAKYHHGDGPAGRYAARVELQRERADERRRRGMGGSELRGPSRIAAQFQGPGARGGGL
jgi:hypothetical protein